MNKSFAVRIFCFILPFLPFTSFACYKKSGGELQSFQFYYSDGYYHVLPMKENVSGNINNIEMSVVGCTNLDNSSRILAGENSSVHGARDRGEECAILYGKRDCQSSRLINVDPSLFQKEVNSFHLCSWNRFHDDIIDYVKPPKPFPGSQSQVLLYDLTGFRDFLVGYNTGVEECQNLPQKADKKVSSVLIEGYQCLHLYQDKFCQGASFKLFNNDLDTKRGLDRVFWDNRASSIKACGMSFQALITTFSPISNLKALNREKDSNFRKLEITPPQSFSNNGTTPVWNIYEGRRTFNETYIFEGINSFKPFQVVEVSKILGIDGATNINWNGTLYPHLCFPVESVSRCIAAKRIEDELRKAYQFLSEGESQEMLKGGSRSGKIFREFSVQKNVSVPPCTKSEVTSLILVKENISLTFELGARILGENRGQRMTAEQLRSNLPPGMIYLKDLGPYEIFGKVGANIVATIGVKSAISVRKSAISDCARKEHLNMVDLAEFISKYKIYLIVAGLSLLIVSTMIMCLCSRMCVNRIKRGGGKGKRFDLITIGGHVLRIEVFSCSKCK